MNRFEEIKQRLAEYDQAIDAGDDSRDYWRKVEAIQDNASEDVRALFGEIERLQRELKSTQDALEDIAQTNYHLAGVIETITGKPVSEVVKNFPKR